MLRQLLAIIAEERGVCTNDQLARRLGVSQELIGQLMGELLRLGCLRLGEVEQCQPTACAICPIRSTCEPMLGVHLWELTEKGRRWLGEPRGSVGSGSSACETHGCRQAEEFHAGLGGVQEG